jgi:hypothetical protein
LERVVIDDAILPGQGYECIIIDDDSFLEKVLCGLDGWGALDSFTGMFGLLLIFSEALRRISVAPLVGDMLSGP